MVRFCGRPFRLDTLREVLVLAVLDAGVAPAAGALVGSLALLWEEAKPLSLVWPLLRVGDATGVLIVAPLALVLMKNWRRHGRRFSMPLAIEAGGLGLIFAGVGVLALGGFVPFAYLTIPVLLWAAVRFEFEGAAVAVVLLAAMTAALMHTGVSQFVGDIQTQTQKHVLL